MFVGAERLHNLCEQGTNIGTPINAKEGTRSSASDTV